MKRKPSRRPAEVGDFEFAREVHHEAYREWVTEQFGSWDEEVQNRFFRESWERWPYEIIVFEGHDCGYCAVEMAEDATHLREFAMAGEYRGKGVGGLFLRELAEEFGSGDRPFYLRAFKANSRAISFYRKIGFKEIGSTDTQLIFEWPTGEHEEG